MYCIVYHTALYWAHTIIIFCSKSIEESVFSRSFLCILFDLSAPYSQLFSGLSWCHICLHLTLFCSGLESTRSRWRKGRELSKRTPGWKVPRRKKLEKRMSCDNNAEKQSERKRRAGGLKEMEDRDRGRNNMKMRMRWEQGDSGRIQERMRSPVLPGAK